MKRILVTTILVLLFSGCSLESLTAIKPVSSNTPKVEVTTIPSSTPEIVVTQEGIAVQEVTTTCVVLTGIPRGYLNLRAGAGIEHAVVTTIPEGASLLVTGNDNGEWKPVSYGGYSGWVNSNFIGDCK